MSPEQRPSTECPACARPFVPVADATAPFTCPRCGSVVLDAYCDLTLVGHGGMGDIFRARQPKMGNRVVAIKIPRSSEPHIAWRFAREISASARLAHPNIVRAYDCGRLGGREYLVMEFVGGPSLRSLVDSRKPLSPKRIARFIRDVARGLSHAADKRIVNRDIKPDNILIAADDTAKILDYGLALIANDETADAHKTRSGTILGTPGFLSPEQARDPHSVTIAADIYALGCTAYYAFTRQQPFPGSDPAALPPTSKPSPSARKIRPDTPVELDVLIQEMLSAAVQDRPTPRDIVSRLESILPRLSDASPVDSRQMVDVACPRCGEVYHLRASSLGKRMTCNGCRHSFTPAQTSAGPPVLPEIAASVSEAESPIPVLPASAPVDLGPSHAPIEVIAAVPLPASKRAAYHPETLDFVQSVTPHASSAESSTVPMTPTNHKPPTIPVVAAVAVGRPDSNTSSDVPPIQITGATAAISGGGPASSFESKSKPTQKPNTSAARSYTKPRKKVSLFKAAIVSGLLLGALAVGYKLWHDSAHAPETLWADAMENYNDHRWTRAARKFADFAVEYPDDVRAATVPFLVDMSVAGEAIYSQTGDAGKGLAAMEEIFRKYRDSDAYRGFFPNLETTLEQLTGRLIDKARKTNQLQWLDSAAKARELMATVGAATADSSSPAKIAKLAEQIQQVRQSIKQSLARTGIIAQLKSVAEQPKTSPDAVYASVDKLLAEHPELGSDKEIKSLRKNAYQAEASRIVYVPEPENVTDKLAPRSSTPPAATTMVIIGGQPGQPKESAHEKQVVLGLARGVLYAFDSQGNFLWSRRLGLDTQRLPLRIEATEASPAALIAVSAAENSLLALDTTTGRLLWQYRVGEDISVPPVLVSTPANKNEPARRRGFLSTSSGEIHVIELVLGKRLGRFEIGQPVSTTGVYDAERELVLMPAERGRVFALNSGVIDHADQPACYSVLMTDHASGSLRGAPIVIGPYMIMSEAADLEHMQLRAFELGDRGFADPESQSLERKSLQGWSWFGPSSSPDRIVLTTDEGDLGVFGVNLDNRDEALYRVIESDPLEPASGEAFRSMAVHSDEHLLWVMAGGTLRHLALDVLRQRINTIWPTRNQPAQVIGVPVHEAQLDSSGQVFYLNLMSRDGSTFVLTAVDSRSGNKLWERPLGISVAGDPLVKKDGVLLLDQAGRDIAIPLPSAEASGDDQAAVLAGDTKLFDTAIGSELMRLGNDPSSPMALAVPLQNRNTLAIKQLTGADRDNWKRMDLPQVLAGQPAIAGAFLAAPCADGYVHFTPLDSDNSNAAPPTFAWSRSTPPGPDQAHVYAIAADRLLVIDSARRVRRLDLAMKDGSPYWKPSAGVFESPLPLLLPPIVAGKRVLLANEAGSLYCLDADDPGHELWSLPLGGRPNSAPVLRNKNVVTVIDNNRVVCVAGGGGAPKEVTWTSPAFKGRICGQPTVFGNDAVLIGDNSRAVTALQLKSGSVLWTQSLPSRLGPAAAPVAVSADFALQALTDGTVVWLRLPDSASKVAEVK